MGYANFSVQLLTPLHLRTSVAFPLLFPADANQELHFDTEGNEETLEKLGV